ESRDDEARGGPPVFTASAFATADLNHTGQQNFIIAAYTNGFSGIVRLLQRGASGVVLIDQPNVPLIIGIYPTVELLDLDGDGIPEAIVSFSSAKGATANW